MTELILTVENDSILPSLRKVLSNIAGVTVKTAPKRKKKGSLELALEDAAAGRVSKWENVDELFDTVLNDEI